MSSLNFTREQYIKKLLESYSLVSVLSNKNDCKVLHLRHKQLNRDLVLRSFPQQIIAYEILCGIICENLPEVYDAVTLCDGQIVLEEYISGVTVADIMKSGYYSCLLYTSPSPRD